MPTKTTSKVPKYVTQLYIIGRQLTIFVTVVLALVVLVDSSLSIPVKAQYPYLLTAFSLSLLLIYFAPDKLKTPRQLIRRGARWINVLLGSVSALLFSATLLSVFTGIVYGSNSTVTSFFPPLSLGFGLLSLLLIGGLTRYYWQGILYSKPRQRWSAKLAFWNVVDRGVAICQALRADGSARR